MPPVRLPRVAAPAAIEAWYVAQLERLAAAVAEAAGDLVAALRELAAEQARVDADDAPPPIPIKIFQGLDRFWVRAQRIGDQVHTQVVAQAADKVEVYNGSNVADVARGLGLSVKPLEGNAYLQAARARFLQDNTALIKDIPEEMRKRIEDKVRTGVESGKRWETLAKDIEEEGEIGKRRARLIARDQVNKYNGALTQARQQKLGISHFRWQGAMDARERPEHIALQGRVFAWDAPPPGGPPGQPIQCRCVAIPVVSDAEKAKAETMTEADLQAATQQALAEHGGRAKRAPSAKPKATSSKTSTAPTKPTKPTKPVSPGDLGIPALATPGGFDVLDPLHPLQKYIEFATTEGRLEHRDAIGALPPKMLQSLLDRDGKLHLPLHGVTESPAFYGFKGVHPQGWPKEYTWDDLRGGYNPEARTAVTSVEGLGGGVSVLEHEIGHQFDHLHGYVSMSDSYTSIVNIARNNGEIKAAFGGTTDLDYLAQAGAAGYSETWAESFALYYKDRTSFKTRAPTLFQYVDGILRKYD